MVLRNTESLPYLMADFLALVTHSNNLSVVVDELFDHFAGSGLKERKAILNFQNGK